MAHRKTLIFGVWSWQCDGKVGWRQVPWHSSHASRCLLDRSAIHYRMVSKSWPPSMEDIEKDDNDKSEFDLDNMYVKWIKMKNLRFKLKWELTFLVAAFDDMFNFNDECDRLKKNEVS